MIDLDYLTNEYDKSKLKTDLLNIASQLANDNMYTREMAVKELVKLVKEIENLSSNWTQQIRQDSTSDQNKTTINPNTIEETERTKLNHDLNLSSLLNKKQKVEETHTRRTFLVKNELLERLDKITNEADNIGFKTEFINLVIEYGLNELERK